MAALVSRLIGIVAEFVRVALVRRRASEFIGFIAAALICLGIAYGIDGVVEHMDQTPNVFDENGPVETVQAFIVGFAGLLFYLAALRFDFEIFFGSLGLSFFCGLAVLREVPGCNSPFYDGGLCLTNNQKDLGTFFCAAAVLGLLAIRREPLARRIRDLNFFWILPAGIAGSILVFGELGEHFGAQNIEETLETTSYLFLTAFAVAINARPHWFDARKDRRFPAEAE